MRCLSDDINEINMSKTQKRINKLNKGSPSNPTRCSMNSVCVPNPTGHPEPEEVDNNQQQYPQLDRFEMKSNHIKEINSIKQLNLLYQYLTRKIYASQQQHQTINTELLHHYFYIQSELKVRRSIIEKKRTLCKVHKQVSSSQLQYKNNQHFEQFNQLQFFLLDNSYRNQLLNPTYQQMFLLLDNKLQNVMSGILGNNNNNNNNKQEYKHSSSNDQPNALPNEYQFFNSINNEFKNLDINEFKNLDEQYKDLLNNQMHDSYREFNSSHSEHFIKSNFSSNPSSNQKCFYEGLSD